MKAVIPFALASIAAACTHAAPAEPQEPAAAPVAAYGARAAGTPVVADAPRVGGGNPPHEDAEGIDYEECANVAISAYNDAESGAPEYLVYAARCFESAGKIGHAIRSLTVLVQRHPDSGHVEDANAQLGRLYFAMIDADAALATPVGAQCVGPIEGQRGPATGAELVAVADCLYETGAFVGAALEYRHRAAADPATIDVEENQKQIEKLEKVVKKFSAIAVRPSP